MSQSGNSIGRHRPWRALRLLVLLLLICVLAGCATRPGPEVLKPTPAAVPNARLVTIYVATTRERASPFSNVFTSGRAPELNYAEFKISIPPRHRTGHIDGRRPPIRQGASRPCSRMCSTGRRSSRRSCPVSAARGA